MVPSGVRRDPMFGCLELQPVKWTAPATPASPVLRPPRPRPAMRWFGCWVKQGVAARKAMSCSKDRHLTAFPTAVRAAKGRPHGADHQCMGTFPARWSAVAGRFAGHGIGEAIAARECGSVADRSGINRADANRLENASKGPTIGDWHPYAAGRQNAVK